MADRVSAEPARAPVLVTGGSGMLGSALARILGDAGVALGHDRLDINDQAGVAAALARWQPSLVVNCAAATDVDRCENDHSYAQTGNVDGPAVLATACARQGIGMVHVSTDYVFAGDKGRPYVEDDLPGPLNYYGLTKLQGEEAVLAATSERVPALVVRTSWVFGAGAPGGASFPDKVIRWASDSARIQVVADQWGSPTYAPFLARGILDLAAAGQVGVCHLAGDGCASRLDIARHVAAVAGLDVEIEAATRADFPTPAPRPRQSCLDCGRAAAADVRLPPWTEGVRRYLVEILEVRPASAGRGLATAGGLTPERRPDQS